MAPESIDKDVCELRALEVACATRAGLISAGAHISYRKDFTKSAHLFSLELRLFDSSTKGRYPWFHSRYISDTSSS